nr:hypothetical protein [uncultured Rhodopila sp.]
MQHKTVRFADGSHKPVAVIAPIGRPLDHIACRGDVPEGRRRGLWLCRRRGREGRTLLRRSVLAVLAQLIDNWRDSLRSAIQFTSKPSVWTLMDRMQKQRPISRLHSKDPAAAAWRAQQAQVDADIEGLSRDPAADRMVADMDAQGISPRDQIARLKAYFKARQEQKSAGL